MSNSIQKRPLNSLLRHARKVRVVVTVAMYTVLSPFGCVFFMIFAAVGRRDPIRRARRIQRMTTGAYRFMHAWLRLTRITRFDPRHVFSNVVGPCVVVANHPTLMDITSISAALGGGCTIVKPALFRRSMLHPLLVGAGHIEGPGEDPVAAGRVVDEAVQRIEDGFSMIIFPEGTRSPEGQLRSFGRAAFEIACRARVPVVSVSVRCEPLWLSKEVPLFNPPHPVPDLQLEVLATDDPAQVSYDSRRLRRLVEGRFQSWIADGRQASGAAVPDPVAVENR